MQNMKKVTAKVFRYDPSRDTEPRYETYEVPYSKDMRILDVLQYIQQYHDSSLAFKYSCRRQRCGACTVMVNGRPVLACFEGAKKEMCIEPLRHFPIIRDLVVDTKEYETRTKSIHPILERSSVPLHEPEKLDPEQFEDLMPMQTCVECLACMGVCPAINSSWSDFAGPAPLVQLAKFALDPRDELGRIPLIIESNMRDCKFCYSCAEACPIDINVLKDAILKLREKCAEQGIGTWTTYNALS